MEDVSILYSRESQFDGLKKLIKEDLMGWEVGGSSGSRTHAHPWQIHVNVWQNHYNTLISLQLK